MAVLRKAAHLVGKPFSSIPGPKLYPLIGNLPQYVFGPFDRLKYQHALLAHHKEYGPIVKENLGGREIIHVFDPDDIKTVYSHEGKYPEIPPLQETTQLYRAGKQMSLGIGNTNGDEWYRLRSNAHHRMLRPKEVAYHLPRVNGIAQEFSRRLENVKCGSTNEVNDLKTEVGRWNLETAGMLVFDKRLGCFELGSDGEEFSRKMVEANSIVFELAGLLKLSFPLYRYIATPKWRKMVHYEDYLYSEAIRLVEEAIKQFREEIEKDTTSSVNSEKFYLLSYLLSKEELSLKDVTVICLSVFLDGLSTTSPSLLFILYSLATNNRVQEKVYKEVTKVVGMDPNTSITPQHIAKMTYLKAFVKETFRMWPNGTEVSRYIDKDMILSGFEVPAGTHVDLNPNVNFRNPQIFPDPDLLIPERWIQHIKQDSEDITGAYPHDEGDNAYEVEAGGIPLHPGEFDRYALAASKAHPFLLTPFSHGTRMCAGRRFAEQHLYVVLATLVRKFNMQYPAGESMGQVYHTLLFPDRPIRVIFKNRH